MFIDWLEKYARKTHNLFVYVANKEIYPSEPRRRVVAVLAPVLEMLKKELPDKSESNLITVASVDLTDRDLHGLIQSIAEVEEEKHRKKGRENGREAFANFLYESVYESDFEKLRRRFLIPEYDTRFTVAPPGPFDVQPPTWFEEQASATAGSTDV